jgi:parvulin-like peptidyl-prolyl isomerase
MMPFTKRTVWLALLALGLAQWPAPVRAASPAQSSDPVVATGKGFVITRSQLNEAFLNYSAGVAAQGGAVPEDRRNEVRAKLLDQLILTRILTEKATAEDKAATWKAIDDQIAQFRKAAPSPQAFDDSIKATGRTLAQVRQKRYEDDLPVQVLVRETTNGISISAAAVKKFYDDNPDKFQIPEEVHVSHILILALEPADPLNPRAQRRPMPPEQKKAKEKLAREIKARADKGENFATLVKQYSDDAASKDKGGEYTFARGRSGPEFEAAAFSLKTNQISDVVETPYGYHIIKLLNRIASRHESFAEAETGIKNHLLAVEAGKARPAYLARIKAEFNVAVLDPDTGKPLPPAGK